MRQASIHGVLCMKPPPMTRDEWFNSKRQMLLRLLNNFSADILHKTQETYDILNILLIEEPDLVVADKFTIVERQLRVMNSEAWRLQEVASKLMQFLTPDYTDLEYKNASDGTKS